MFNTFPSLVETKKVFFKLSKPLSSLSIIFSIFPGTIFKFKVFVLKSLFSEIVATDVIYPFAINLLVRSETKLVISVLPKSLFKYFSNIFSFSISFNRFSSSSKFIWDIWNLISFVAVSCFSAFSNFNWLKFYIVLKIIKVYYKK